MIKFNSKLITNRGPLMVCCSGGVDSIAAAHFLIRANRMVSLFHFNHKLRPQNDQMKEAVSDFAADMGVWGFFASAEKFPIDDKDGLEAGAREARLKAIGSLSGWGNKFILGHHLDDAVESYLMNCFNGKTDGWVIPPASNFGNFTLYRPFLLTPKDAFREYAKRNGLEKYVIEDETNTDTSYRRNFVRNVIVPTLRPHYPGLHKVVAEKVKKDYCEFQ